MSLNREQFLQELQDIYGRQFSINADVPEGAMTVQELMSELGLSRAAIRDRLEKAKDAGRLKSASIRRLNSTGQAYRTVVYWLADETEAAEDG